jgi:hypothetical protein
MVPAALRLVLQQSEAAPASRLNPRHSRATSVWKTSSIRNLSDSPSVSQSAGASHDAKAKLPTIYTGNDFVLIMLHYRSARTISVSVTSRERVGRSMRLGASAQGETIMNASLNHGSAKIYQFPVGGRSGVSGGRQERRQDETSLLADLASSRVTEAAVGDAWYHDAAIQESKPVSER